MTGFLHINRMDIAAFLHTLVKAPGAPVYIYNWRSGTSVSSRSRIHRTPGGRAP
jgi:hypothetical protein